MAKLNSDTGDMVRVTLESVQSANSLYLHFLLALYKSCCSFSITLKEDFKANENSKAGRQRKNSASKEDSNFYKTMKRETSLLDYNVHQSIYL